MNQVTSINDIGNTRIVNFTFDGVEHHAIARLGEPMEIRNNVTDRAVRVNTKRHDEMTKLVRDALDARFAADQADEQARKILDLNTAMAANNERFIAESNLDPYANTKSAVDAGRIVYVPGFPNLTVRREGDTYIMRGAKGEHRLNVAASTNNPRFDAHWAGFKSNNGVA